jgi:signal peptidase I
VRAGRSARHVVARLALVVLVVLAALWVVFLRPTALGGRTAYVVVSGPSMEPTLRDDDLVVVRERSSYAIGDVIAFRVPDIGPEGEVIHRIVGGSAEEGFVTRGDNREVDDNWRVYPEDILGRRLARIPRVGAVLDWLAEPMVLGLMVGAALATLYWAFRLHRERERRATAPASAAPVAAPSPNGHRPRPAPVPVPPAPVGPVAATPVPVPPAPVGPVAATPAPAESGPSEPGVAGPPSAGPAAEPPTRPTLVPDAAPWPDADPGGHDEVATRIRERYERADPETRVAIRQLVFEQAMAFKARDPDFDTAAFLRACGAHAYEPHH